MADLVTAAIAFMLLITGAAVGIFIRPHLPQERRTAEGIQSIQLMLGMLVTFAALVLGLLTASVKNVYDLAGHDRREYSLQLLQLDQCLRNYGSEAEAPRALLESYTAASIASTWPFEPRPMGVQYPDTTGLPTVGSSPVLAEILNRVGLQIRHLTPPDAFHTAVLGDCHADYGRILQARIAVIDSVGTRISTPFEAILVFWLMIIFATFGLIAPRDSLSVLGIGLCAVSLSSAIFVISDLSEPYGGLFAIPSTDMRTSLMQMTSGPAQPAQPNR